MKNIILILFLWIPLGAFACSCKRPPPNEEFTVTIKKAYDGASAVVVAKAKMSEMTERDYEITEFLAIRSWKGKFGDYFRTKVNMACCVCGISFVPGETYLLYLNGPDENGYYDTHMCMRTTHFKSDRARQDIQFLNELVPDQGN